MASLVSQHQAAAIFYAVLGRNPSLAQIDLYGQQLQTGTTSAQFAEFLISSNSGATRFDGMSDSEILQSIYTGVHGVAATTEQLNDFLTTDSVSTAAATIIDNLLNYSGSDETIVSQQTAFENKVDALLFPSVSSSALGQGAADIQAILHVMGASMGAEAINYFGAKINAGMTITEAAAININARGILTTMSDEAYVARLFQFGYERAPTEAETANYVNLLQNGSSRADVLVDIIEALRGTVASGDQVAQEHFVNATTVYQPGQLPDLAYREQVAAVYLGVPERGVDASGLDTWSKQLASGSYSYDGVIGKLLSSSEFQRKGADLTGDDFIQHVYTAVHGAAASATVLAQYAALGTNKATITQAIIDDLRSSTATDATTVTQQHAFEAEIGTSLLYKTAANLTATAAGGNATGTVNTGTSHVLSNAETAVLKTAVLDANAASTVNLKFADNLDTLTINGTSAATVNLSDNGVSDGVDITVNNGNVILNASSGADDVVVTASANISSGTGDFNLGAGNDSLKWAGNAATDAANIVGAGISANGGDGIDTISANFITKNVAITGTLVRTATITSNSSQFSNFEKLDLAGYIGKATVTGGTSTAANNTFDFGVLTGNATTESSTTVTTTNQAATSNIGSQGFVLSGLAEAVKVINAAGGNSAQLEVTGDATAESSVGITFRQNATNKFDINFTAGGTDDINAGSLSLSSSSSALLGTALQTVNIASGGAGVHNNILNLTGTNAQIETINVTGSNLLDLTIGSGYSNLATLDASANTGGLDLVSNHAGSGQGLLYNLLALLPLGTTIANLLGLGNGNSFSITGTNTDDNFTVLGNTDITGGAGDNTYTLTSSTTSSGVTLRDFSTAKDNIVDVASGLTLSGDASGTGVADYGVRTQDVLDALLGTLVGGITGGVIGLLGSILGLPNGNALTDKVGVSTIILNNGDVNSYVIIDNNNDGVLDANDSVIYLENQSQDLVNNLHYAPTVALNGISSTVHVADIAA